MNKIVLTLILAVSLLGLAASPLAQPSPPPVKIYLPAVLKDYQAVPPQPVEVLPDSLAYEGSTGTLHIVGEVRNNTQAPVEFIQVSADIKNDKGEVLTNKKTYVFLDVLPGGEKTCFDISLPAPAGWKTFTFGAPTYLTGGTPLTGMTLLNPSASVDPALKWYVVSGQVRNDLGQRVEYVAPIATLYNAAGKLVGCDFEFVNGYHLDAGQTGAFTMNITGRDFSDVSTYRLQVDGQPK